MITRLENKLKFENNIFTFLTDKGEEVSISLDESAVNKLLWLIESSSEMTFSTKTLEWDLFFGPYIKGASTGYIFQAINLYTRECYSLTVPFTENIGINDIKGCLITITGQGGAV